MATISFLKNNKPTRLLIFEIDDRKVSRNAVENLNLEFLVKYPSMMMVRNFGLKVMFCEIRIKIDKLTVWSYLML